MEKLQSYTFPKGISIKIRFPNTNKFVDYITTKQTVFGVKQIRPEFSNEKVLAVSVRYHLGLIPREHITEWKLL